MFRLDNIKIIFIDIDGTLSNSKKEISEKTTYSIKRAIDNGIKVILCSGRDNSFVINHSKKANCSTYVISCNGSCIYNYSSNEYLQCNKIKFEYIEKINTYCQSHKICCIFNGKEHKYSNLKNTFEFEKDTILIDDIEKLKSIDIFQIVLISKDYDSINNFNSFINDIDELKIAYASSSYLIQDKTNDYYSLDVTNKCVSKGDAIKYLLKHFNLQKENAIGFGDHINDKELFDEVGIKVAMENATDELKKHADFITLSNDNDGVAYFLDNYINR